MLSTLICLAIGKMSRKRISNYIGKKWTGFLAWRGRSRISLSAMELLDNKFFIWFWHLLFHWRPMERAALNASQPSGLVTTIRCPDCSDSGTRWYSRPLPFPACRTCSRNLTELKPMNLGSRIFPFHSTAQLWWSSVVDLFDSFHSSLASFVIVFLLLSIHSYSFCYPQSRLMSRRRRGRRQVKTVQAHPSCTNEHCHWFFLVYLLTCLMEEKEFGTKTKQRRCDLGYCQRAEWTPHFEKGRLGSFFH